MKRILIILLCLGLLGCAAGRLKQENQQFQESLKKKDEEIRKLEEALKEKDLKIEQLRKKLEGLGVFQ